MTIRRFLASTVPLFALAVLAGCSSNGTLKPATSQVAANEAVIQNLIATDPAFAVSFDDGGNLSADATTASAQSSSAQVSQTDTTAVLPVRWGRWRVPPDHPPVRTITFVITPDSDSAVVKVNVKFNGWFFVDVTDDGVLNPGKKPLRDQKTRYALFKKIWFHPDTTSTDSVYGWRLAAVSPIEFTMIDPSRQTVAIHSVTLTGPHTHVTITDPSSLLSLRRGSTNPLPLFQVGDTVRVEAAVTNTDTGYTPPTFVYLHVPVDDHMIPFWSDWVRVLMFDDGTHGDVTAGDGVYTALWPVRSFRRHHIAVDVLNSRCLQNETNDDYNSTTWAIPYESYPSFLTLSAMP